MIQAWVSTSIMALRDIPVPLNLDPQFKVFTSGCF